MRFTVRSLGGKLVISAALMLLLCILLFSVTSWFFLKSFYELKARNDATSHLAVIKNAYQAGLITEADKPVIAAYLTNSKLRMQASEELAVAKEHYHLASISIISMGGKVLIVDGDDNHSNDALISQALHAPFFSHLLVCFEVLLRA